MYKSGRTQKAANGPRVAVIGCGIFGAMIALRLAEGGASVEVYERGDTALLGASYNNQNRLHLGFHYPRDDETAKQCMKGFHQFRNEFSACLMQGFSNAYFIANSDSITTSEAYLAFCERVGLHYDVIDLKNFFPRVQNVALGVMTDEIVYDCNILRQLISEKLNAAGVQLNFNSYVSNSFRDSSQYKIQVNDVENGPFDAVVNCTYANINQLNAQLGYSAPVYQYEYTMVPIIEWEQSPIGITVMDGRFMTVLPFGKTGKFLLYHVEHTVCATEICTQLPEGWLDAKSSPSQHVNENDIFQIIKNSCSQFVPNLKDARLAGFLQGPRMVLANRDSTDSRPSIINRHEQGYWSVFTGKIDHCMWVADEISKSILVQ